MGDLTRKLLACVATIARPPMVRRVTEASAALGIALLAVGAAAPMTEAATVIAWDAAHNGSWELSNGGRTATSPNTGRDSDPVWQCFANQTIPSGRRAYFEVTASGAALFTAFTLTLADAYSLPVIDSGVQYPLGFPPDRSHFIEFSYNGRVQMETAMLQVNGTTAPNPVLWTDPVVVGIAVDTSAHTVQYRLSDSRPTFVNGGQGGPYVSPTFDISKIHGALRPMVSSWKTPGPVATINGGSAPFAMPVPAGFTALDTLLSGGATSH